MANISSCLRSEDAFSICSSSAKASSSDGVFRLSSLRFMESPWGEKRQIRRRRHVWLRDDRSLSTEMPLTTEEGRDGCRLCSDVQPYRKRLTKSNRFLKRL